MLRSMWWRDTRVSRRTFSMILRRPLKTVLVWLYCLIMEYGFRGDHRRSPSVWCQCIKNNRARTYREDLKDTGLLNTHGKGQGHSERTLNTRQVEMTSYTTPFTPLLLPTPLPPHTIYNIQWRWQATQPSHKPPPPPLPPTHNIQHTVEMTSYTALPQATPTPPTPHTQYTTYSGDD